MTMMARRLSLKGESGQSQVFGRYGQPEWLSPVTSTEPGSSARSQTTDAAHNINISLAVHDSKTGDEDRQQCH